MSDEGAKPQQKEVLPGPARRQAAAETVTTIAETFEDQAGPAKQIAMDAAGKTLETFAPGQAVPTTDPDTLKRATGLIANDIIKPGPNLIKRVINWVEDHL